MTKRAALSLVDDADLPALPSQHIDHANVYRNECDIRMQGFQSGIVALQGEMEGYEQEHQKIRAALVAKHEAALEEMDGQHAEKKSESLRRIQDMERGKLMAAAALDAFDAFHGKEGEAQ